MGARSVRIHVHVRVFERYLWRKRHADGNECPGFSDVSPIIAHSLRESARAFLHLDYPRSRSKFLRKTSSRYIRQYLYEI